MPGRGPAPKPPAQRRRRNKPKDPKKLPAAGHQGDFPPLPKTYDTRVKTADGPMKVKVTFLASTRQWYTAWGRSPMATQFTDVDWQRLQRLARLVDQYDRHPDQALMAEIRLQEASFGGTPLDRRRLNLEIEKPPAPGEAAPADEIAAKRRARLAGAK
jgi:hypothetical protein